MLRKIDELCPHCDKEISVEWDIEENGYVAICPACNRPLKLCSMCIYVEQAGCNCNDNECEAEQRWKKGMFIEV